MLHNGNEVAVKWIFPFKANGIPGPRLQDCYEMGRGELFDDEVQRLSLWVFLYCISGGNLNELRYQSGG